MNKIDKYIEEIYTNFDEDDPETKIIKEETKTHLLDKIEELKIDGFTENQSIYIAIENFGNTDEVTSSMKNILNKPNKILKVFIIISIILYSIGFIFKSISLYNEIAHPYEPSWIKDDRMTRYVVNQIKTTLQNKDEFDENLNKEITSIIKKFNERTNGGLYYLNIKNKNNKNVFTHYVPLVFKDDGHAEGSSGTDNFTVIHKINQAQHRYDLLNYHRDEEKREGNIFYKLNNICNYFFIFSWMIFCSIFVIRTYSKNTFSFKYLFRFILYSFILISIYIISIDMLIQLIGLFVGILMLLGYTYNKKYHINYNYSS